MCHKSAIKSYRLMSIRCHAVFTHVQLVLKAKLICHLLFGTLAQAHCGWWRRWWWGLCTAAVQSGTAPDLMIVKAFCAIVALGENTICVVLTSKTFRTDTFLKVLQQLRKQITSAVHQETFLLQKIFCLLRRRLSAEFCFGWFAAHMKRFSSILIHNFVLYS